MHDYREKSGYELREMILETYCLKLFLERKSDLFFTLRDALATLPRDVLELYVRNSEVILPRPDTPEGRREGGNKLAAMLRKINSPVTHLPESPYSIQYGVSLDQGRLESLMISMQTQRLDPLRGDWQFTHGMYDVCRIPERYKDRRERREKGESERDSSSGNASETEEKRDGSVYVSCCRGDSYVIRLLEKHLAYCGIEEEKMYFSMNPLSAEDSREYGTDISKIRRASVFIQLITPSYLESSECIGEATMLSFSPGTELITVTTEEGETTVDEPYFKRRKAALHLCDSSDVRDIFLLSCAFSGTAVPEKEKLDDAAKHLSSLYAGYVEAENEKRLQLEREKIRDGYHEVKDRNGRYIRRGEYRDGEMVEGVIYDVILKAVRDEDGKEVRVPPERLYDKDVVYYEFGTSLLDFVLSVSTAKMNLYYMVNKYIKRIGEDTQVVYCDFRPLESCFREEKK